jgi:hypothetical protein
MRRFLLRGLVAAAGAALPAVALADPPADPPPSRPLLARLNPFGGGEPPAPGPRVRPPVGPLSDEVLLGVLQAEKDAWTRRLEVCHRLREIAHQTNDDKLDAKANDLEKQATAAYHERVSRLGVKSGGPLPPLPAASAAATASLDKSLGSGVAKTPLDSPKPAAGKTATAKASAFKEVGQ